MFFFFIEFNVFASATDMSHFNMCTMSVSISRSLVKKKREKKTKPPHDLVYAPHFYFFSFEMYNTVN